MPAHRPTRLPIGPDPRTRQALVTHARTVPRLATAAVLAAQGASPMAVRAALEADPGLARAVARGDGPVDQGVLRAGVDQVRARWLGEDAHRARRARAVAGAAQALAAQPQAALSPAAAWLAGALCDLPRAVFLHAVGRVWPTWAMRVADGGLAQGEVARVLGVGALELVGPAARAMGLPRPVRAALGGQGSAGRLLAHARRAAAVAGFGDGTDLTPAPADWAAVQAAAAAGEAG